MRIIFLFLCLSTAVFGEDWTVGGKDFHNVKVDQVESDRVHISYDGGVGTVALADLSPELQKKFGYDPNKADAESKQREENIKPDWEKVSSKFLLPWVDTIKQQEEAGELSGVKAQLQEGKISIFNALLSASKLNGTTDATIKQWIDCIMQDEICVGMPKELIPLAWGNPDSDTVTSSGDGDDWETMTFGHWSSMVFIAGGVIKNITTTTTTQN